MGYIVGEIIHLDHDQAIEDHALSHEKAQQSTVATL